MPRPPLQSPRAIPTPSTRAGDRRSIESPLPPREPSALAGALNQLLADEPRRQRMGAAARDRAWREFTHTAMIEQTIKLYERLLGGEVVGE